MKKIRKAIIPAAGMGTRFLPATKAMPKEMLPIVDKPSIQYIIEEAVAAGIEDILIITGRNKTTLENHFDRNIELEMDLHSKGKDDLLDIARSSNDLANIYYVRQKYPHGLGHAILCGKSFVGDEAFAVLLGDDLIEAQTPCIRQLIEVYETYGGSVLGCQNVQDKDVSKYGIADVAHVSEQVGRVRGLVEKPSPEEASGNLAVLGRYVITPDIFHYLETQTPGAGGEIQLTDALMRLAQKSPVFTCDFKGRRYDVGDKLGFIQATLEFALRRDDLKGDLMAYLDTFMKNPEDHLKYD